MSSLRILGIDLSSQPKNTAAWMLHLEDGRITSSTVFESADDNQLDELIETARVIGIDVPFGWPDRFRTLMQGLPDWPNEKWSDDLRDTLRLRLTDRVVRKVLPPIQPLSVSADRIALPAMRAMGLLARWGVGDRSGLPTVEGRRFVEVYPAATLKSWGLPFSGYKTLEAGAGRGAILKGLQARYPDLGDLQKAQDSDHALDALVAALTTVLVHQGKTIAPNSEQLPEAKTEGWIHIPKN
jgi:predicted nuclease with RNAse H fold